MYQLEIFYNPLKFGKMWHIFDSLYLQFDKILTLKSTEKWNKSSVFQLRIDKIFSFPSHKFLVSIESLSSIWDPTPHGNVHLF